MCGICLLLRNRGQITQEQVETFLSTSCLCNRGPDVSTHLKENLSPDTEGFFWGCTLHFRGDVTPQPVQDLHGNRLLWNGEIFSGVEVTPEENDGSVLLHKLGICNDVPSVLSTMANIQGPWAFIYWQCSTKTIWFGRDIFGRRSLLYQPTTTSDSLSLSSIAIKSLSGWVEVPAKGIYAARLKDTGISIELYPWQHDYPLDSPIVVPLRDDARLDIGECGPILDLPLPVTIAEYGIRTHLHPLCRRMPSEDTIKDLQNQCPDINNIDASVFGKVTDDYSRLSDRLVTALGEAVETRIKAQANICDLCLKAKFGRQDTCKTYWNGNLLPTADQAAANDASGSQIHIDASVGHSEVHEIDDLSSHQMSALNIHSQSIGHAEINSILTDSDLTTSTQASSEKHKRIDVQAEDSECVSRISSSARCGHARVGVLFSGGIDSLMLAALAHRFVPEDEPIDLMNVAFEQQPKAQPQKGKNKNTKIETKSIHDPYLVPDRKTGLSGLEELKKLGPNRQWNFIEINIPKEELQAVRAGHIKELVHPLASVLDDSIGCAIWFAARGQGQLRTSGGDYMNYTSTARVVLVGMGADEQLGGYSRHRVKFNTGGWPALLAEIEMEVRRISERNMGRDDRIISDHGKEARFPFLDERVVSFLNSLPVWEKANLYLPRGYGEKFLLRLCAWRLGLTGTAILPKRAIQFGSRIAKMENKKEKASDVCSRLLPE